MVSTSLYQLSAEYLAAADKLADLDLPEEVVADTLESLKGDLEVKSENVAKYIGNLEGAAKLVREAAKAQIARADAIEKRADRIRAYLLDNMLRTGISKIECPFFVLSVANNPPKVVIDGEVPAEFMRTPEPPPPAPDKKAIGEYLKAGGEANWAHMEVGKRLVIK